MGFKLIKKVYVGRQTDALNLFKHIILSFSIKILIYRALIMLHFTYCSSVWHSCLKESDYTRGHDKGHDSLCSKIGYSSSCRRKQDMLLLIFKDLLNSIPQYIQSLFNIRENKVEKSQWQKQNCFTCS